jgi:hypothetical protein
MSTTEPTAIDPTADDLADAIEHVAQARQDEAVAELKTASPLDASLMRGNPRQRHGSQTVWTFDVMTVPNMAFDPAQVTSLEHYEELEGWGVNLAVDALKALHGTIGQLIEARETLKANQFKHPGELALDLDDLHTKLMPVATRKIDGATASIGKAVAAQEAELKQPITEGARGPFAAEVRAYARGLNTSERLKFFNAAVNSGDMAALGACLGAPAYLSGLAPEMVATLTEQANRKRNPLVVKRIALLKGALDRLEAASGVYMRNIEQIVGVREATIRTLRVQREKVRKAVGA